MYYTREIKKELALEIDEERLFNELEVLYKYDLIENAGDKYGGVFDRTLKKVLMVKFSDLLSLPADDFNAYFRNDSMMDYLREKAESDIAKVLPGV